MLRTPPSAEPPYSAEAARQLVQQRGDVSGLDREVFLDLLGGNRFDSDRLVADEGGNSRCGDDDGLDERDKEERSHWSRSSGDVPSGD